MQGNSLLVRGLTALAATISTPLAALEAGGRHPLERPVQGRGGIAHVVRPKTARRDRRSSEPKREEPPIWSVVRFQLGLFMQRPNGSF
jgi:hypothetical protein